MEKKTVVVTLEFLETIQNSVQAVMRYRFKSISDSYYFGKTIKSLDKVYKSLNEEKNKLLMEYGKRDENGNIVTDRNNIVAIQEDRKAEFFKKRDELYSVKEEVEIFVLPLLSLEGSGLNPMEITPMIGTLIEEPKEK